ncbi:LuxR C-terminal-related transcriptional regulator, partial [Klebsiella pneumoniae]|uniref:LuxR C-terminal-related transcriptional regulator n=1 Tax=Klebsiella pneumoniae TaxID=573 RepID=UPI00396AAD3F
HNPLRGRLTRNLIYSTKPAAALNISPKTIHSHKKNIMSKFNLNSRQQFNNLVQLLAKR